MTTIIEEQLAALFPRKQSLLLSDWNSIEVLALICVYYSISSSRKKTTKNVQLNNEKWWWRDRMRSEERILKIVEIFLHVIIVIIRHDNWEIRKFLWEFPSLNSNHSSDIHSINFADKLHSLPYDKCIRENIKVAK